MKNLISLNNKISWKKSIEICWNPRETEKLFNNKTLF